MSALSTYVLSHEDDEIFLLGGFAGTGKTSLIAALVKSLNQFKIKSVLLAPTGRAAKVLSGYSGRPASTIHRRIYTVANDQSGTKFKLAENQLQNAIFIVDEASMISGRSQKDGGFGDGDLLQDLIEYVYSAQGCKLIFSGDVGQLPPVSMDFSPALNPKYLFENYKFKTKTAMLQEIVRQEAGSAILALSMQLRKFEKEIPVLTLSGNDVEFIDSLNLQDSIENSIAEFGRENTLIVCRSNKQANLYNRQIRNRILWFEDEINAGDTLMALSNNYFWLDPKSEAGFIANGQMMEIQKLIREEEKYGLRFADAMVIFPDYPGMGEVQIKIIIDSIHVNEASLPAETMRNLYNRITVEEYADIANRRERLQQIRKNPFFQAVQVKFGYAVTCHKSQGGQWDAVFVDQGYFVDEMWDRSYMRWLYTAVTRAKKKLFLVNLNPAFSGKSD